MGNTTSLVPTLAVTLPLALRHRPPALAAHTQPQSLLYRPTAHGPVPTAASLLAVG